MSRSRRHNPVLKDGGHSHKEFKQASNRIARRQKDDLPIKGNRAHRAWSRLYRWEDIVENVDWMDYREAIRIWEREEHVHRNGFTPLHNRFATKKRWLGWWKSHYLSK